MLQQEYGTLFVGFSHPFVCEKCGNNNYHTLRQKYVKQSILFIPIQNSNHAVFMICPICEKTEVVVQFRTFQKEKLKRLSSLLEGGKEATKHAYQKLDRKEKDKLLKRLNALEAYSVVRYICE